VPPTSPTCCPKPGAEPVPGYRLIEPIGKGGFGEVWKCEAPGGLFKAIKFVGLHGAAQGPIEEGRLARQEREALERMKTLRHPFILSLERVEEQDGVLLIIMELADRSLHRLYQEHRHQGQPGLPRDELLGFLLEAAEALDWMNFEHGLQHLDVKPHNLFVISGHVKVADFGLVNQVSAGAESLNGGHLARQGGGVTPIYSAPELLRGTLSRHSDQYSLAVVYQQLLTGSLPFWHENVYDLVMQHMSAEPDLSALPPEDCAVVARALAKMPEQRYPSCMDFVQDLLGMAPPPPTGSGVVRRSGVWRRVLMGPLDQPPAQPAPPVAPSRTTSPVEKTVNWPGPPEMSPTPPSTTPVPSSAEQTRFVDVEPSLTPPRPKPAAPETPPLSSTPMPDELVDLIDGVALAAPTSVSLPGYRFHACLTQTSLADVWSAEDKQGRPRRALCLLSFVRYDARLISHLQTLRDPSLPATEVHWSPAERLVVLTDWYDGTLRDRLEERQAEGLPGIPREELLPLLRSAADALDGLAARAGMPHLGIHPRNLLIDGPRLHVADYGLIPLVWLPTGQPASAVNGRYAAPELFENRISPSADQYSLALLYAEMVTGIHPRPNRPGSGLHRRPDLGLDPRTGRPPTRSGQYARPVKISLDLLPAQEREVVARALATNPDERFSSCTAFIEALDEAMQERPRTPALYAQLPPVIPYASLMGEPPPPDVLLPSVHDLVCALTAPDPRKVNGPQNTRYFIQSDGSWEYRCPLQVFPGALRIKVAGFAEQWSGRVVHQQGDSFRLHLELPVQRSFWDRFAQSTPSRTLEMDVAVEPPADVQTRRTEAKVRLRYLGGKREQADRILAAMGPQLFDSLRMYLQATPEQRGGERWPFTDPIHVYPVLPDLELAPTLEGVCRDVSFGGIRFRVPQRPSVDVLYLHLCSSRAALGYALLVQVTRAQETAEGVEVGARFLTRPPVAPG
jgi:serine/threonine protein kinase